MILSSSSLLTLTFRYLLDAIVKDKKTNNNAVSKEFLNEND